MTDGRKVLNNGALRLTNGGSFRFNNLNVHLH
jgi:hypothetical protein